jgi:hypothetical protein
MLDLNDDLFPLIQAPRHFPGPRPPHVGTFIRWALQGVGRKRTKLETVKIGGRRYTSRAALVRFVAALTGERELKEASAQQRTRAYLDAAREMDMEGL